MENAEEIFHFLEEFSKRKPKTIPQELNEYLAYVARTGDPVYQWSLVKSLFKEKLLCVITDFHETTPGIDIPPYPNVDPFNYDVMKNSLLERLDSFTSAPFTVQRICELLTYPRKQYNRIDKFMRAIEKNILVVSTREPGTQRHAEPENGEPMEPVVNGSDNNSEYNVDVEMEDMSWKENVEPRQSSEPQPSSSDAHISVDNIEARLKMKQNTPMDTTNQTVKQYESVTPPELNLTPDQPMEIKTTESVSSPEATTSSTELIDTEPSIKSEDTKPDIEMKVETETAPLVIPEIKVDDAEMTEQQLTETSNNIENVDTQKAVEENICTEDKTPEPQVPPIDENSSDSSSKEETEPKLISEVSTSSEESSSSSDNTDGNSNSPKHSNCHIDIQEESNQSDFNPEPATQPNNTQKELIQETEVKEPPKLSIQSDNYSISDVNSELPQPPADVPQIVEPTSHNDEKEPEIEPQKDAPESKADISEVESEEKTT